MKPGVDRFRDRVALSTGMSAAATAPRPTKPKAKAPADIATATRGSEHVAGFFDVYRDAAKGRVLLGVHELDTPFLLVTSLPWGLGSNDVGLDRGQSGESHLVEFRRAGPRLLLVEDNTKFRAVSSNRRRSARVRQAFAESVLWAGDIVGERKGADAEVIVDVGPLLTSDRHGIARRLAEPSRANTPSTTSAAPCCSTRREELSGQHRARSAADVQGPGRPAVRQGRRDGSGQPDAAPALQPRAPAAAGSGRGATTRRRAVQRRLLRLLAAARVEPRRALPAALPSRKDRSGSAHRARSRNRSCSISIAARPSPCARRCSKARTGGRPRSRSAGFKDAFRVELLPEGADPMDVRYNMITVGASRNARLVVRPADRRSAHRRDHQGRGDARLPCACARIC